MSESPNQVQFEVDLHGCRSDPLASYLKALGVFRIVAEQKDPEVRGAWRGEHFVIRSSLDSDALVRFFTEEWKPAPVVSPWNAGSGFWPSTSDDALRGIETSDDPRLAGYAATIAFARRAITVLGLTEPAEKGEPKTRLLTYLRANASEEALDWLDAAAVLTDDDPVYPALLGTGGNDGRQDFSNNFMQRVRLVLQEPGSLTASLFGASARVGSKGSMGQFSPTALDRSNPWDFILAIEGSLVLAGAATRRLESRHGGSLAFPFHARSTSAPSLADGEDGHGELWLPLWTTLSTCRDVRRLFAEGRAKAGAGSASTGLDFARSIAGLGVDRGLSEFVRFSFQPRNGKNYFATSLGHFATGEVRAARLLDNLDHYDWYARFRQNTSGKTTPAAVALARRQLELAMFEGASTGELRPVLLALAAAERSLSRSLAFAAKAYLNPIPRLQSAWGMAVSDGSVEQRLAAALATRAGMHGRLVPLEKGGRTFGRGDDSTYVFRERPLVDNLHALLLREDIEAQQREAPLAKESLRAWCSLSDIAEFIDHRTDDQLIERWLRAFVLVDSLEIGGPPHETLWPPAAFAVLAIVHHRHLGENEIARTTSVLARACTGDAIGATAPAIRRLNASARPLPFEALVEPPIRMRRIAAALAFPLTTKQRRKLESMVLPAVEDDSPATTDQAAQEIA